MRTSHALLVAAASAALVVVPAAASAQTQIGTSRNIGVGLALGYPNIGLALNFFMNPRTSIQVDASFGWRGDGRSFGLRGDYLFWMPPIAQGEALAVRWYVGPGIFTGFAPGRWCYGYGNDCAVGGGAYLGVELPIGIGFQFKGAPIDLMVEAVPLLGLVYPGGFGPWFDINAAVHLRFYF